MEFEWDNEKAKANEAKHGISFASAPGFEILTALVVEDDRQDYGEKRLVGIGLAGNLVTVIVFTERDGRVRVISMRRANRKEIEAYVENF